MKYFHLRSIVSILTACLFCYSKEIFVTAKYRTEEKHLKAELTMEIFIDCGQEILLPDNGIVAVSPPRLITQAALFRYQLLQACRSGRSFRFVSVVCSHGWDNIHQNSRPPFLLLVKPTGFQTSFGFLCPSMQVLLTLSQSGTNQYTNDPLSMDFLVLCCILQAFDF